MDFWRAETGRRNGVLVPSLGILLFNNFRISHRLASYQFSSPLWGFFYLIGNRKHKSQVSLVLVPSLGILLFNRETVLDTSALMNVLVPSLGILLFNSNEVGLLIRLEVFSSPLWGFFYLMGVEFINSDRQRLVLVPSLGILLFNNPVKTFNDRVCLFSSPLWGFFYLIINQQLHYKEIYKSSRPLSGDSFI